MKTQIKKVDWRIIIYAALAIIGLGIFGYYQYQEWTIGQGREIILKLATKNNYSNKFVDWKCRSENKPGVTIDNCARAMTISKEAWNSLDSRQKKQVIAYAKSKKASAIISPNVLGKNDISFDSPIVIWQENWYAVTKREKSHKK